MKIDVLFFGGPSSSYLGGFTISHYIIFTLFHPCFYYISPMFHPCFTPFFLVSLGCFCCVRWIISSWCPAWPNQRSGSTSWRLVASETTSRLMLRIRYFFKSHLGVSGLFNYPISIPTKFLEKNHGFFLFDIRIGFFFVFFQEIAVLFSWVGGFSIDFPISEFFVLGSTGEANVKVENPVAKERSKSLGL